MFPSFTGSARPKRQVNLSGRNSNPFVAHSGSRVTSSPHTSQGAIMQAQQDRILRQQERERPPAAIWIQKTWRGHRDRKSVKDHWRIEWDAQERWHAQDQQARGGGDIAPYQSEDECLAQLRLIGQFVSPYTTEDIKRLHYFILRYLKTLELMAPASLHGIWFAPLHKLARLTIRLLRATMCEDLQQRTVKLPVETAGDILRFLVSLSGHFRQWSAADSWSYYGAMADVAICYGEKVALQLQQSITALLYPDYKECHSAYEGFVSEFLSVQTFIGIEALIPFVDYKHLADAFDYLLFDCSTNKSLLQSKSKSQLLWVLARFIYFRRRLNSATSKTFMPDAQYIKIVSKLLSFLADDIEKRIDLPESPTGLPVKSTAEPLPEFIRSEISTLVYFGDIDSLLTNLDAKTSAFSEDAATLASYALMLLRIFPKRSDEIRMALFRGSTSSPRGDKSQRLTATKYFHQAASTTQIFKEILEDPRATVSLLKEEQVSRLSVGQAVQRPFDSRDHQWQIILLFLELYNFMLRIMDDEDFLSGSTESNEDASWTRQSALPLDQVESLTIFLKNLTFSLYWNVSEIIGIEAEETSTNLAALFGRGESAPAESDTIKKRKTMAIAGVSGWTLAYLKGLVTGVLRMLYDKDSRRKFLPAGHWLMTRYFEMDRFISAVVREEEEKHQIERSYEDDSEDSEHYDNDMDISASTLPNLVGTSRTQNIRNSERLKRQQQRASRKKYLESVTPRLEILQNMPFFIPFKTRVQIFREFVLMDQLARRRTTDADEWRFLQMNSPAGSISKHRAKVRRKNVFDDAYEQFYSLGDGLKEPIQIRFVDEFDTVEEGIDGGGVTKEFLTSITNEAFGTESGIDSLFVENDQHLLYPNPNAVEERKEALRLAMYSETSPAWRDNIRDLLRRYEFLGRIIGKCLYEEILVDIHFAPFFLLKWALTGGSGNAPKESSYRAILNDLRDLDEGLYQGLLHLKNYSGNVEDFSLNFAVTDNLRISPTQSKTVTHDLRPQGADIPVTKDNRLIYIAFMARYRLQHQPRLQTDAFLRGLGSIVSPSWLSMFNQSELQNLIGGTAQEVNVADLRANTQYGGIYVVGDDGLEHPSIQIFWKIMQDLDDSDRKKVLKFVTSTPRAPLLGFGNLIPRFSIRDSGSDQTRLPSTSTCVNLLKLPIYKDEDTLRERLLYSINSGAGFDLS